MKNQIDPKLSLSHFACVYPETLPVMNRLDLPYAVNGEDSLEEAVRHAGLDLAMVMHEMAAVMGTGSAVDWMRLTLTELCDNIEQSHHLRTRDLWYRIAPLPKRIFQIHGRKEPELQHLERLLVDVGGAVEGHLHREERVVFPWLRALEMTGEAPPDMPWRVDRPIGCLVHDHELIVVTMEVVKRITNGFAVRTDLCAAHALLMSLLRELEVDGRMHMHKENNILFPRGLALERQRLGA
jgi:regulator of cell morphogenesis and NO signaling